MGRLLLIPWGGHPRLRMPRLHAGADAPPARTGIRW